MVPDEVGQREPISRMCCIWDWGIREWVLCRYWRANRSLGQICSDILQPELRGLARWVCNSLLFISSMTRLPILACNSIVY
jgi:hypothetical protein